MPLLQTRATLAAGEDTATFPLWSQKDGRQYEARLVDFNARVGGNSKLEASVKVVRRIDALYGFSLQRIYGGKPAATKNNPDPPEEPSIDVSKLSQRFPNRFRDLRDGRYSVLRDGALPHIEYDKTEKRFMAYLPRRTSLATEDPFLFGTVLGFDLASLPPGVVRKASGVGMVNESLETAVVKGRVLESDYVLRDALPANVTELPAQSVVHAGPLEDTVTLTREVDGAHAATIARVLQETADDCLEALSVQRGLLRLKGDETDADKIEIAGGATAPATNVVKLTFEFSVVRTAGGKDEILNAPREVVLDPSKGYAGTLSIEEDEDDPLRDRYPLTLLCLNHGSADSFIVGRGPQSILALVREPGHILRTSRAKFPASYHLVLGLIDKFHEPVRATRSIDIFLSFVLKPVVVVVQGK